MSFLQGIRVNKNSRDIADLKTDVAALSAATHVPLPISEPLDMNNQPVQNSSYVSLHPAGNESTPALQLAVSADNVLTLGGVPVHSESDAQTLSRVGDTVTLSDNGGSFDLSINNSGVLDLGGVNLKRGSLVTGWSDDYPIWKDRFALIGFDNDATDKDVAFLGKPLTDAASLSFYDGGNNGVLTAENNVLKWNGATVAHPESSGVQNPMDSGLDCNNYMLSNISVVNLQPQSDGVHDYGMKAINTDIVSVANPLSSAGQVWLSAGQNGSNNTLQVSTAKVLVTQPPNKAPGTGALGIVSKDQTSGQTGYLDVAGTSSLSLQFNGVDIVGQNSGSHDLKNVNELQFDNATTLSSSNLGDLFSLNYSGKQVITQSAGGMTFNLTTGNTAENRILSTTDLNTFKFVGNIAQQSVGHWMITYQLKLTTNWFIDLTGANSGAFRVQLWACNTPNNLDHVTPYAPYKLLESSDPSYWSLESSAPGSTVYSANFISYNFRDNLASKYSTFSMDPQSLANRAVVVMVMTGDHPEGAVTAAQTITLTGASISATEHVVTGANGVEGLSISGDTATVGADAIVQTRKVGTVRASDNTAHVVRAIKVHHDTFSRLTVDLWSSSQELFEIRAGVHRDSETTTIVGSRVESLSNPGGVTVSLSVSGEYVHVSVSGSSENIDWKSSHQLDTLAIPDLGPFDIDSTGLEYWYPFQTGRNDSEGNNPWTINWTEPEYTTEGAVFISNTDGGTTQLQKYTGDNFDFTSGWTFSVFMKRRSNFVNQNIIFAGIWQSWERFFAFAPFNTVGGLEFKVKTGSTMGQAVRVAELSLDEPTMITVVYTPPGGTHWMVSSHLSWYINGQPVTPLQNSAVWTPKADSISYPDGSPYNWVYTHGPRQNITVAHHRKYNRSLSAEEVANMYTFLSAGMYTYLSFNTLLNAVRISTDFAGSLGDWVVNTGSASYNGDNTALDLGDNDSNSYVLNPLPTTIDKTTQGHTISFWIKTTANPVVTNYPTILFFSGTGYIHIGYSQSGSDFFYDFSYKAASGSAAGRRTTTAIVNGEWHHFTARLVNAWDGGANSQDVDEVQLLYDGAPDAGVVTQGGTTYSTFALTTGYVHYSYRNEFELKGLKVWNQLLSDADVAAVYNQG